MPPPRKADMDDAELFAVEFGTAALALGPRLSLKVLRLLAQRLRLRDALSLKIGGTHNG